jgi:hypothetical protein
MMAEWPGVLLFAAALLMLLLIAYLAGVRAAARQDIQKMLARAQITRDDVLLYRRAARIMARLINAADLASVEPFSIDILTEPTRTLIKEWLDAYKKQIDKV